MSSPMNSNCADHVRKHVIVNEIEKHWHRMNLRSIRSKMVQGKNGYGDKVHFRNRIEERGFSEKDIYDLRFHGVPYAIECGTEDPNLIDPHPKYILQWRPYGQNEILEGVFATDGDTLSGITVYKKIAPRKMSRA